jgi:hypothetical protein
MGKTIKTQPIQTATTTIYVVAGVEYHTYGLADRAVKRLTATSGRNTITINN